MDILEWIMAWYKLNCDGDWEHTFGVRIETLDNPGWMVHINLESTDLEGKDFVEIKDDKGEADWITCRVVKDIFEGYGDPDKLEVILKTFREYAEANDSELAG